MWFGNKINRLQRKSTGLLNTFTMVVEGLKEANISASKEIESIGNKVAKLSNDEMELIKLTESNNKVIANITKMIQ